MSSSSHTPWIASCDAERVLGAQPTSLDALIFSDGGATTSSTMSEMRATYCVDTSGSTSGAIMTAQKASAAALARVVKAEKVWGWGSAPKEVKDIEALISDGGGTCPQHLAQHFLRDGVSIIVLYTDGEVSPSDMQKFREGMLKVPSCPVVIVLTLGPSFTASSTVGNLSRQVNMSVPEACLSMASHALVLLNFANTQQPQPHRVLMSSGEFARHFLARTLADETELSALGHFEFAWLSVIHLRAVPAGCVQLPSVSKLVDLNKFFALAHLPLDTWSTLLRDNASVSLLCKLVADLSARIMLPRLDTTAFHETLVRISRAAQTDERSVALSELRKRLAVIAVDPARKGSDEHRALLAEYAAVKASASTSTSSSSNDSLATLRRLIADALGAIAAYKADATAIVLGSNRANRANVATEEQLLDVGDCIDIDECPIFLCQGPACILLRAPRECFVPADAAPAPAAGGKADAARVLPPVQQADPAQLLVDGVPLAQYCSTDDAMENPFAFGTFLAQCITPGVYCLDFACEAATNPLTRDAVIGFIPLTRDPLVLLRHLGKVFCAKRELWHLVRGWTAAVATHLQRDQWAAQDLMREHIAAICELYVTNDNLKGADESVSKVPLLMAVQNVLRNFAVHLRDRTEADIQAICVVSDVLQPTFAYDRAAVLALARLVQTFARLLGAHKRNQKMLDLLLPVDELGWATGEINRTLEALIAWLFHSTGDKFRLLRLQEAIDQAMLDRKFGPHLLKAFATGVVDASAFDELVVSEPDAAANPHFGALPESERFGGWDAQGRIKSVCVYCGAKFSPLGASLLPDGASMTAHIKAEFGTWFFSGNLFAINAFNTLGAGATEAELFRHCATRVQRHFGGELDPRSRSQFVKHRLLHFIRRLRQERLSLK